MSCGGGSSSGGGPLISGPTLRVGNWLLSAKIRVVLGGTAGGDTAGTVTDLDHTSTITIHSNGSVSIVSTDSTCALTITANGNVLIYREECVFAGSNPAPCTLAMRTNASIIGDSISGAFGPESRICSGNATSYSGTLSGNIVREQPDEPDEPDEPDVEEQPTRTAT